MNIAEKSLQLKQDFDSVYEAGFEKGKSEGGDTEQAYNEGFEAGYNNGADATRKILWDGLQNKGYAANYYYAFAYNRFDDSNFNPPYKIKSTDTTTGTQCIFYNNTMITDTKVEIIAAKNAGNCFNGMSNCHTIRKFTVNEDTSFNNTFNGMTSLVNIEMGGTIAKDISFVACGKLSDESIQSIIDHLGAVTTTRKITFHTDVVAKLTDEQADTILAKGWDVG
jgi:hypothetical protein